MPNNRRDSGAVGAARAGMIEAASVSAIVLGFGYIGFGSVAKAQGFTAVHAWLSTFAIWALPGQLIFVEMKSLSAPFFAIALAVALSAARFFPMTVALVPLLRVPGAKSWRYYLSAHILALSVWAVSMRRCPALPVEQRLPYYLGFGLTMWLVCMLCTVVGYYLAGSMPPMVTLALVYSNPLYFALIMWPQLADRVGRPAIIGGAIAGPIAYLLSKEWSVILGGLIGGTAAFFYLQYLRRKKP